MHFLADASIFLHPPSGSKPLREQGYCHCNIKYIFSYKQMYIEYSKTRELLEEEKLEFFFLIFIQNVFCIVCLDCQNCQKKTKLKFCFMFYKNKLFFVFCLDGRAGRCRKSLHRICRNQLKEKLHKKIKKDRLSRPFI